MTDLNNTQQLSSEWTLCADLTIYEAAFWTKFGADPRHHFRLCDANDEHYQSFMANPDGDQAVWKQCEIIISAVRAELIATTHEVRDKDNSLNFKQTFILKSAWLQWCRTNGYTDVANKFSIAAASVDTCEASGDTDEDVLSVAAACEHHPAYLTTSEIVLNFMGLLGVGDPAKVLSEYPAWATRKGALVSKGRRGRPTLHKPDVSQWNPVQFALNLLNKRPLPTIMDKEPLKAENLDVVFRQARLSAWEAIWKQRKPYF